MTTPLPAHLGLELTDLGDRITRNDLHRRVRAVRDARGDDVLPQVGIRAGDALPQGGVISGAPHDDSVETLVRAVDTQRRSVPAATPVPCDVM